jgi:hypothetical protein
MTAIWDHKGEMVQQLDYKWNWDIIWIDYHKKW